MNIQPLNLFQIRQIGLEVLSRELGPVGMIRFLQQYEIGSGDYSMERHQWLDKLTIDDITKKANRLNAMKKEKTI
ncbi:conserved hypothetical protein [Candidatus Magnetomoraceae bacterium gMMP-15]